MVAEKIVIYCGIFLNVLDYLKLYLNLFEHYIVHHLHLLDLVVHALEDHHLLGQPLLHVLKLPIVNQVMNTKIHELEEIGNLKFSGNEGGDLQEHELHDPVDEGAGGQ